MSEKSNLPYSKLYNCICHSNNWKFDKDISSMLRFYFNEVISVQLQYNCKYRLSWHWVTGWSFSEGEDYDLKRYVSHLTQGKWERRHTMKKNRMPDSPRQRRRVEMPSIKFQDK